MGISGLNDLLRSECPDVFTTKHMRELCGYIIAVDISVFLYKYVRSYGDPIWIKSMIQLLCTLKGCGIKTVTIFDGENYPPEKEMERERRRGEVLKTQNKYDEATSLREKLKQFLLTDVDVPEDIQSTVKTLVGRRKIKITNLHSAVSCLDILSELCEKIEKQILSISENHKTITIEILEALGMPYIQAEGEAETLCCYLISQGMVDAVLSEDTDILAYGAPIMVSKFDGTSCTAVVVNHVDVLNGLNLSEEEFRDLCIMLSCDYNQRCKLITKKGKAVGIGPKRAYNLIIEYRNLDSISEKTDVDTKPLNYKRCRELLKIPKIYPGATKIDKKSPALKNNPLNSDSLHAIACRYNVMIDWEQISEVYKPVEMVLEEDSDDSSINEEFEGLGIDEDQ